MDKINKYWNEFLEFKGLDKGTTYLESFHFELSEKLANELLQLVLIGKKKATASSLLSWQAEDKVPKEGDYSIVTDWNGNPKCVIQTTKVTILPFKDVDYELCKKEGEDDSLESWREGHRKFFKEEGRSYLNYEFTEDLLVVFEEFEIVYK